jgi:predicted alpha/beta hydrolase
MTGGMGVNKEPGTDRFAVRFQDSGFAVLAFDHKHLAESGGQPRQVVRIKEQLADWQAALDFAPNRRKFGATERLLPASSVRAPCSDPATGIRVQ